MKFKYRLDRRCRIVTWSVLGGIVASGGILWFASPGGYLTAWFLSIAAAVVVLLLMSAPRSIRATEEAVEVRCVVEITHIPYTNIRSVRRTARTELGVLLPAWASMGIFGHFGYYFDVRGREFIKVYATGWHGLVLIEDIYEQKYLVSADEPDKLISEIELFIVSLPDL